MIKLAIFDLDGTLLRTDKTMGNATVEAIKALKTQGVNVAIATGRGFEMATFLVRELGLYEGPIVTYNGAMIYDLADKRLYKDHTVGKDAQVRIVDYAVSNNHAFVIYNTAGVHTLPNDRVQIYEEWNQNHPSHTLPIHIHDDAESLKAIPAHKMLIAFENNAESETVASMVEAMNQATATKSQTGLLDVISPLGAKGEGTRFLMDHYGVTPDETIAFGDNDNDAQMLEQIPLSFAMKNATMKAKQAASHVTALDHDHDGVADTLYKTILKN